MFFYICFRGVERRTDTFYENALEGADNWLVIKKSKYSYSVYTKGQYFRFRKRVVVN